MRHQIQSSHRASLLSVLAGILFVGFAASAQAQIVLTPLSDSTSTNPPGIYAGLFSNQPSSAPTLGPTSDAGAGYYAYGPTASGSLDLGANAVGESIVGVDNLFYVYGQSGPNYDYSVTYWFSSTPDSSYTPENGDVLVSQNLGIFTSGNNPANNGNIWVQSFSGNVTIADEYLNYSITGATSGTGNSQLQDVILVESAPEPSTVALAILGGLGLFVIVIRRRRQFSNI